MQAPARYRYAVEKSGTSRIRVTDDGEGMVPEDLALSVERHSTSKLRTEDDLFRIATLGFRGEALPSIGSVAKLEIISRPAAAATGHRIRIDGGRKVDSARQRRCRRHHGRDLGYLF